MHLDVGRHVILMLRRCPCPTTAVMPEGRELTRRRVASLTPDRVEVVRPGGWYNPSCSPYAVAGIFRRATRVAAPSATTRDLAAVEVTVGSRVPGIACLLLKREECPDPARARAIKKTSVH